MRKIIAALGLVAISACPLAAQRHIVNVHRGGTVIYSTGADSTLGITFANSQATFAHEGGGSWASDLSGIDSLTFVGRVDTTSVDTATAVRITWNGSVVSVVNPYATSGVSVSTSGAAVTVQSSTIAEGVTYLLGGSSAAGSLTLASAEEAVLVLDDLTLSSTSGPAIKITSEGRTTVLCSGTSTLTDSEEGAKGAMQSVGDLTLGGSGVLNLYGMKKQALQCSGTLQVVGGTVNVMAAAKHGFSVGEFVMSDGAVSITTDADASKCIKSDGNVLIAGGTLQLHPNGSYASEADESGNTDLSYCTGIKADANLSISGGSLTVVMPTTNLGGKGLSVDGNVNISGGTVSIDALGGCGKYIVSGSTYDSYAAVCIKADSNISITGGTLTLNATGRAVSCDGDYSQSGGSIVSTTTAAGFTVVGSGTSCTDGFAAACLKVDGDARFSGGSFSGTSTGTGGRGIKVDGSLTCGVAGEADSLLHIFVKTSGAPVNASSGGGWGGGGGWPGGGSSSSQWKGLPKGIKVGGNMTVNSGVVQSFCAQTSGDPTGEAIETKDTLFVHGGYVEANAYDDAINAANHIRVDDGHVWAYSRGNDGIDCNGQNIRILGGTVIAYGARECAIDDNADNGGTHLYISDATVIAVPGSMGAIEGTPSVSNQKYITIGGGGGGWGGGGGSSSGLTTATNGVCVKNSSAAEVMTFKMPTVSSGNSGFEGIPEEAQDVLLWHSNRQDGQAAGHSSIRDGQTAATDMPQPKRVNGLFLTSPDVQSGTYTYYTSPSISGGSSWHGLYTGATVTTTGNGSTVTAQ